MARIRSIKPEFWKDELVGSWPALTRLAYIALWNEADDEGRLRAHPTYLRSTLFPYEPDLDMEAVLKPIVDSGRLVIYQVDGQTYGFLPRFAEHQSINKPTESKLPSAPSSLKRSRRTPGAITESSVPTPGELPVGKEQGKEQGTGNREQGEEGPAAVAVRVLSRLNAIRGGRGFDASPELEARIREGVPEADLLAVVEAKAPDLLSFERGKFCRPKTLFGPKNFANYLQEARAGPARNPPREREKRDPRHGRIAAEDADFTGLQEGVLGPDEF